MSKLRVAFVGCGGVAAHYLNVYRALDFVQVAALVDSHLPTAEAAAASFANSGLPAPRVSSDYAAALVDNVDVVVINTPNHLHRDQALAAFAARKHVLLQKPVAPTVREAEEIADAASRSGTTTGLYMSYFDNPLMHDLRRMIETEWFGEVGHFYARLMHRFGLQWSAQALAGEPMWRGSVAQTGGGCFIQLAVHFVHLMEWMSQSRIVRAQALTKRMHCLGLEGEDFAATILEFDSGAAATLDMAWSFHGEQLAIHGTEGSAEYINNRTLILESRGRSFSGNVVNYTAEPPTPNAISGREQRTDAPPPAMGDAENPFNQHRAFLEAVRDGRQPFVSIAEGVHDLRVVAAVYEAARKGCAVEVNSAG